MPYIQQQARDVLEMGGKPSNPGELNYTLTKIIKDYTYRHGLCYNTINEVVGVLQSVQQEYYRRVATPYEDEKIRVNGDV